MCWKFFFTIFYVSLFGMEDCMCFLSQGIDRSLPVMETHKDDTSSVAILADTLTKHHAPKLLVAQDELNQLM